ncbi:MAG: UvrD-helicase domain-containing protein [Firmicutes bacterium]|nr:UvrD-helicase domain-containing protein [Bacillota bacterium]
MSQIDLSLLNKEQLEPVMQTEGAVLVTAGAGSGKTRLLTYRIAHIVQNLNIPPWNILAITFTNKAAREMKERLSHMLYNHEQLHVSTFHSLCVTILRKYIELTGEYTKSFSIYDESERKKVIKSVAAEICSDKKDNLTEQIDAALSTIKNEGISLDDYRDIHKFEYHIDDIVLAVRKYNEILKKSNALDFDDLLNFAFDILVQYQEAREFYQKRFKYIHVDEFQDTNIIQYKIVKILAGRHKNILVVGDEDQSIYGWRGANIGNIRDFISDFDCKVYKLEQNYRSTKSILNAANAVIKNNESRIKKNLWSDGEEGQEPQIVSNNSDSDEAEFLARTIKGLNNKGMLLNNIAVLMRNNFLSRAPEQKFMFYGIPYKMYGGFRFYERREIKDALAYLKILANPFDTESISRVLSFPKKGIGEASIAKLIDSAFRQGVSPVDIILGLINENSSQTYDLPNSLIKKLQPFAKKIELLVDCKEMSISALIRLVYKTFEFNEALSAETEENESRKENLKELYNSILQIEKNNPALSLDEYVQQIMLYSDLDADKTSDSVTIATIHSAKGLEFDAVFIIGLEEGILPSSRSIDDESAVEEERRLMYVAITRARKRLFLSYVKSRFMYGKYNSAPISRFLKETGIYFHEFSVQKTMAKHSEYADFSSRIRQNSVSSANSNYKFNKIENLIKHSIDIKLLKAGSKVMHKRLGEGKIISINYSTNEADVEFNNMGKVTLSISLAPITIIE